MGARWEMRFLCDYFRLLNCVSHVTSPRVNLHGSLKSMRVTIIWLPSIVVAHFFVQ